MTLKVRNKMGGPSAIAGTGPAPEVTVELCARQRAVSTPQQQEAHLGGTSCLVRLEGATSWLR